MNRYNVGIKTIENDTNTELTIKNGNSLLLFLKDYISMKELCICLE